jgi:hypothetical protein
MPQEKLHGCYEEGLMNVGVVAEAIDMQSLKYERMQYG